MVVHLYEVKLFTYNRNFLRLVSVAYVVCFIYAGFFVYVSLMIASKYFTLLIAFE